MAKTIPNALYVVATPLGNLGDISARAIEILSTVSVIYAEDTRHSGRMLQSIGIDTALRSLHEHNEEHRIEEVLTRIADGEAIALISDAGTPCISDPGYRLVRATRAAGLRVLTVPGPCAAIAALSIAGLPTDRFLFVGFLPQRQSARTRALAALAQEPGTLVLYESPRRIRSLLDELHAALGERQVAVARELTKLHEEVIWGTLGQLSPASIHPRGELTVIVAGATSKRAAATEQQQQLEKLLMAAKTMGLKQRDAMELARAVFELPRRELYATALQIWHEDTAEQP